MDYEKLKGIITEQLNNYDEGNCDWKDLPEFITDIVRKECESFPIEPPVKPACEKDIRIDELNKLQQTLNPYQMNENDFFRAMMDGTIKNTILIRINELSKSV